MSVHTTYIHIYVQTCLTMNTDLIFNFDSSLTESDIIIFDEDRKEKAEIKKGCNCELNEM